MRKQGTPRAGGAKVAGRKRRALLDLLDQVAVSSSAPQPDTSPDRVRSAVQSHHFNCTSPHLYTSPNAHLMTL